MKEEEKKQVAVFRYGVINEFVTGISLSYGEQERLIREKCARKWVIPFSSRTRISRSCIRDWTRRYRKGHTKLEALYPVSRADRGRSRAMDEDTCLSLIRLREELPNATVPVLMAKMKGGGLITPGTTLNQSTVYRFLHSNGVMRKHAVAKDRRKFEAELPNDLWQSDVMHGPKVEVDGRQKKAFLIAIIDDHSRLIPHAEFYLSEALDSYLKCLEDALLKRGLPRKLYVDNGPAFRSRHLEYITASLNISLIHAKPYQPQGKGKIERWFKTVRTSFLPWFKGTTLEDLNECLDLWVNDIYHRKRHSSTGQTPFDRFTAKMECLRQSPVNLRDHFRNVARRKVAKDRTIVFNGKMYEAPVSLIGKQVELLYHLNGPEDIEIRCNNQPYGIARPVDLHVNCRVKRDENNMSDVIISGEGSDYKGGSLF
jgi:putative transposase